MRAEFRRHHIQRHIGHIDDGAVALPDARCLDDHHIKAGGFGRSDDVGEVIRHFRFCAPRCDGAEVDVAVAAAVDGVHADAVAQQRALGFAARRVDGDDGDLRLVRIQAEAADQLVGQR